MPTPTVAQTLTDPNFQGLPPDQQKIVLGKLDPNFAGLPSDQQDIVLQHSRGSATPQPQTVGQSVDAFMAPHPETSLLSRGKEFLRGGLASVEQAIQHPMQTIQSMGASSMAGGFTPYGAPMMGPTGNQQRDETNQRVMDQVQQGVVDNAHTAITQHPAYTAGGIILPLVAGEAIARVNPVGRIMRKGADLMTGGEKTAVKLNQATADANAAATDSAAAANAKIQSARTQQLNDHFQAIQQAKGEAPTTVGTLPDASGAPAPVPRPMNARELASHKEALNAGVQQLDQQFKSDLISTAKDAKQQLDNKYDTVRSSLESKTYLETGEITPAPSVPSSQLAQSVNNAEAKLMGSSENIKQFKDIISKHPDSDPDFVTDKTPGKNNLGTVPRGNPLYDIIQDSQGGTDGPGATFRDLQGYYTELGDKLSSGGLQGDVYQAMKSLHDDIGGMMKKMAADNGVGSQLADAQDYARNYYADWRDPASPLYKAIKKAPERGDSIAHFQGADQSGIGTLAKYNPELAKRANTIRGYQQQADSISSKPFVEKPVSALAPSTPPVQPDVKTIGPEDIQAANAGELMKRTAAIRKTVNKAALYVTGYRSLAAVGRAMSGDVGALSALPADVGEGMALAAGGNGLASLLESPKVSQYLTKPTPAQVATINPEIARDLAPIVQAAKTKGIRVSPALAAAISAHATRTNWFDQPNP